MAFENILACKEALLDIKRLRDSESLKTFGTYALIAFLGWKVGKLVHWEM